MQIAPPPILCVKGVFNGIDRSYNLQCIEITFLLFTYQAFDTGMKSVGGILDQRLKDANVYADATRDDLEKVII